MKKIILIAFFILLFSSVVSANEQILSSDMEITYEEALNSRNGIMPLSDNTAETESYYDQLTAYEKEYYDGLEAYAESMMNGTNNYKFTISMTIDKGLSSAADVYAGVWEYLGADISVFAFRPVYALMYLDKPQYFWFDINNSSAGYGFEGYYPSTGLVKNFYINLKPKASTGSYLPDCYTSEAQVKADYIGILNKADEIISNVPEGSTDWGKLNCYMNWFKENCHYNTDLTTASKHAYLPTSALLYGTDDVNAPVCEGYSEALKILCNLSGIKAMCTETFYEENGTTTGHKWNLININNKFYHCDPTWFDSYTSINSYRYFLTGSNNMANYDKTQNHTITYQMDFYAPEISATDYLNDMGIDGYNVLNIDGNTVINKTDNVTLLKIISNISNGTGKDVNGDGKINIADVVKMQQLMFK
ncbi:MAG: transglutaminase domain-containing protein [Clostridia bacterium]|nr:transglutaminase domain-containing protein [Clostridia bacterium]